MGIKGLISDLVEFGCNFKLEPPSAMTNVSLDYFDASQYNILIDAQSLLYKFAMSYNMDRITSTNSRNSANKHYTFMDHIKIFEKSLARSLYNLVNTTVKGTLFQNSSRNRFRHLVVVFDGKAPLKKLTEQRNRAISKSMMVQLLLNYFANHSAEMFVTMGQHLQSSKLNIFQDVEQVHFYKCEKTEGEFACVYMHIPLCILDRCQCFQIQRICISFDTDLFVLGSMNSKHVAIAIVQLPKTICCLQKIELNQYQSLLLTIALIRGNDYLPSLYSGKKLLLRSVNLLELQVQSLLTIMSQQRTNSPRRTGNIELFQGLLEFLISLFTCVERGDFRMQFANRQYVTTDEDRQQGRLWLIDFIFDSIWYLRYITNCHFSQIEQRRTNLLKSSIFKTLHIEDVLQICRHTISINDIYDLLPFGR